MASSRTESDRIPLMLIHGAWLSARSWENFADYFAKRGFAVSAPEWPRKRGRRRGAASGGRRAQGPRHRGDRRPLRGADPRARRAAGVDRPLLRRPDRRAVARPRSWTGRRRAQPRAAQGHPRAALLVAQGRGACARASIQVARDRDADARGVHLRVREHVLLRGGRCRLRALCRPGDRPDLLRGGVRELPPEPADRGALQERRARAAAHRGGGEGPDGAGLARPQAVREVRALAGQDGVPRVRGPAAPAHGGRGLGGGRRGDRQLARRRARGPGASGAGRFGLPRHHRSRRWISSSTARSPSSPAPARASAWPSSTPSSPRECRSSAVRSLSTRSKGSTA